MTSRQPSRQPSLSSSKPNGRRSSGRTRRMSRATTTTTTTLLLAWYLSEGQSFSYPHVRSRACQELRTNRFGVSMCYRATTRTRIPFDSPIPSSAWNKENRSHGFQKRYRTLRFAMTVFDDGWKEKKKTDDEKSTFLAQDHDPQGRKKRRGWMRQDHRVTRQRLVSSSVEEPGQEEGSESKSIVSGESDILDSSSKMIQDPVPTASPAASPPTTIPSYRTLLVFLSTTVLIWLSEPLLSLVDTTVVGFTSHNSVIQLASLGPATTLYDSILYLCYFLAISTTNKLAPALALRKYRELQQTTSHLLGVALWMGVLAMIVCYGLGHSLLQNMVAPGPAAGELIHYATRYVWIRSSVAVASIVGMVMQSFCLATLDTTTPAKAVAVASTVNIVGDVLLRKWGVQGAAAATALSSLLSSCVLFRAVRKRTQEWRHLELEQYRKERTSKMLPSVPALLNQTDNLLLQNATDGSTLNGGTAISYAKNTKHSVVVATSAIDPPPIPFVSTPDRSSFLDLIKVAGPIFFVILAKIICYGAMTLRCTDFGVIALATHNIMTRVFFFYGTSGDSLSQAAQSFLPATLYPQTCTISFRSILKRLLTIASILAVVNSNAAILILKRFGRFLARDSSIVQLMADQSVFLGMALGLHPFITLFEGTVIASRDFRTLVTTYAVTLGLHFGILRFFSGSFPAIWRTFFFFQSIRFVNFGVQVWRKQMSNRKAETTIEPKSALAALSSNS